VEAAKIEHQVEWSSNTKFGEPGHVAEQQLRFRRVAFRSADRPRDEVDTSYIPAVIKHVPQVRPGSTAKVHGPTGRQRLGSFDQFDQLRRWDARVPGFESDQVRDLKKQSSCGHGHQA
jgi:hypothetical protein